MNDQTKTPEQAAEQQRVAIHELGHSLVCTSFRIHSSPEVFAEGDWDRNGHIAGICRIDPLATATAFQKSVIGWGGYVGEHICGVQHPLRRNPFPLTKRTLQEFYDAAFDNFETKFSSTDQKLICAYQSHWVSFKGCYNRLRKKKQTLFRLARIGHFNFTRADERKWQGIPRPPSFPATHADFVRLVCGGEERFERFITHKAQAHITNGKPEHFTEAKTSLVNYFLGQVTDELRARHTGKTDAEISDLQFEAEFASAVALQRSRYANFPGADSWIAAARDFLSWSNFNK